VSRQPRLFEPELPIPEELQPAVALWLAYKKEQWCQTYKPLALTALVKRMAAWGPERSMAAVEWSMSQTYQGLFESAAPRLSIDQPPAEYAPFMDDDTTARWPFLSRPERNHILEYIALEGTRAPRYR
jgi:hypothetical protein